MLLWGFSVAVSVLVFFAVDFEGNFFYTPLTLSEMIETNSLDVGVDGKVKICFKGAYT